MADGKLLYRVDEAAEALGLSRVTLYGLMARGELRSLKIGGARRIEADELKRFVADRREVDRDGESEDRRMGVKNVA